MKFEHTKVMNFEGAFRGMRNPMNSWERSDSVYGVELDMEECADKETGDRIRDYHEACVLGEKDLDLAKRLIVGGTPHRKFLRQILVSVDITAPLYWFKEFDTYKVGTVANSTSTMHKLASTPITLECFETDDLDESAFADLDLGVLNIGIHTLTIAILEKLRQKFLETKDVRYWKELVRWLPESWLQTRTVTFNYEVIRQMCYWRTGHKLTEWKQFIDWAHTLPYAEDLIFYGKEETA